MKKIEMDKKVKIMIGVGIVTTTLVGAVIYGKAKEKSSVLESMKIEFKEEKVEYGSDIDSKDLVSKVEQAEVIEYPRIDSKEVGEKEVKYVIQSTKKPSVKKEVLHKVKVEDTQAPIIEVEEEKEIEVGSTFDVKSAIKRVYDVVDGEFEYKEVEEQGSYTIVGSIEVNEVKEQSVKVIATDKNGIKAEKEVKVKVVEKEESSQAETNQQSKPTVQQNKKPPIQNNVVQNQGTSKPQQSTAPIQQPQEPVKQCGIEYADYVGNSGKLFNTWEEVNVWAWNEISDENSKWYDYAYTARSTYDDCGNEYWTVSFHNGK